MRRRSHIVNASMKACNHFTRRRMAVAYITNPFSSSVDAMTPMNRVCCRRTVHGHDASSYVPISPNSSNSVRLPDDIKVTVKVKSEEYKSYYFPLKVLGQDSLHDILYVLTVCGKE